MQPGEARGQAEGKGAGADGWVEAIVAVLFVVAISCYPRKQSHRYR